MALLCAAALVATAQVHQPAFFFSPLQLDEKPAASDFLREATTSDLERTVSALAGTTSPPSAKGSSILAGRPMHPPEVQLVFLAEGLTTEAVRAHGSRLSTLQSLMEKSATSLTVPFTVPVPETRAFADARVHVAGAEAEEYLVTHSSLYTNGAPDTVVVELAAADGADPQAVLASFDATIGRVVKAVHTGTNGRYTALLTGAHGSRGAHRKLAPLKAPPIYLHTTPTLLTAQVVMLMLFVIFLSGFCCLFQLQTPKKFEEVKNA